MKLTPLILIFILCIGCGLQEGVIQKAPKSFLYFTGNTENAVVYIDSGTAIVLNPSSANDNNGNGQTNSSGQVLYEVSPGKHDIIIEKSNEVVVHRKVLLGNGITKEIQVP